MPEGVEPARSSRIHAEHAARLVRRSVELDLRGAAPVARLAAIDQARAAVATVPPGRVRDRLTIVCEILTDLHRDDTTEAVQAAIVRAREALGRPGG
jgi:hypothetical protein